MLDFRSFQGGGGALPLDPLMGFVLNPHNFFFLNISDYRLQPRLFMGWKDVSNFCIIDCTFQVPGL
jgi:hypothetical protein